MPLEEEEHRSFGVQATEIAYREFGRRIIANMVMMGFVNRIHPLVTDESLVQTVRESVPPGTEDMNEAALAEGARQATLLMEKAG